MKLSTIVSLGQLAEVIKGMFVKKEDGKGLSTNDFTNTLKGNYDAAHTHSQTAHAPSDAQENVIESVKVNGEALNIASRAVDITVPTKTSQITNNSDFRTAAQVNGSIATALTGYSTTTEMNVAIANATASAGHLHKLIVESLPEVASADADLIYMIKKSKTKGDNFYDEYMVIEGKWEKIGDTEVDLTGYIREEDIEEITAEEIDALFA